MRVFPGHCVLWAALASAAIIPVVAQGPSTLPPVVEGEVAPGSPVTYTLELNAGDLVKGTLELVRGPDVALDVMSPAGVRIKGDIVWQPPPSTPAEAMADLRRSAVGFAAPVTGTYRVQVGRRVEDAADRLPASFVLRTQPPVPPAIRMRGVSAATSIRYASSRIEQLGRELDANRPDALDRFWADARAAGGPLVEPSAVQISGARGRGNAAVRPDDSVLVTFLWRETFETHNVRIQWGPGSDDLFMTRLPRTDVWYKTVLLRRGSRLQYSLLPNVRPGDEFLVAQRDPLNPRVAWDDEDDSSLLELEGAPDESWFRKAPAARGLLGEPQPLPSPPVARRGGRAAIERSYRIYTPPGYAPSGGPYAFLLMFPVLSPPSAFEAVASLDNLISSGRIRPVIVCFVSGVMVADGDPNAAFPDALVRDFLPSLRRTYPISTDPRDIVVGGWSAGGAVAARLAFRHPDVFGNVQLHSPALVGRGQTNATIVEYRDGERRPLRFYLDVGLYENIPDLPLHELAVTDNSMIGGRHFRDVLIAKGYDVIYRETGGQHDALHLRTAFPEALLELLPPERP